MCISCSLSGMNPLEWIQFHTSPSKTDHPRLGIHTPYSLYPTKRQATTAFPTGSTFKPLYNFSFPEQGGSIWEFGGQMLWTISLSYFYIFLCSTACSHSVFTFTCSIKLSFSTAFFLIHFPLPHKNLSPEFNEPFNLAQAQVVSVQNC